MQSQKLFAGFRMRHILDEAISTISHMQLLPEGGSSGDGLLSPMGCTTLVVNNWPWSTFPGNSGLGVHGAQLTCN